MREGWKIKNIGSVANVYNGNSINADEKKKKYLGKQQGYPFIATKDVGNDGSIDYDNGVRIPDYENYKIAYPNSVFVCAEGGSAGKKVAYIEQRVCFGNKLFALQPNESLVLGKYLYYFVQGKEFKEYFKNAMAGIIGGVSAKKFKEIPLALPPLSEQQRIVDLLDKEFEKIDRLRSNEELNLRHAKDLFQAALRTELEPKEGWKTYSLLEASLAGGQYGMSVPSKAYDGIRYLRITDITDDGELNDDLVSANTDVIDNKYILQDGDILFARTGATVGKTLVYDPNMGKCSYAGYLIMYRPNPSIVLPRLLHYITHSTQYYAWVISSQTQAVLQNISAKLYNTFSFSIPSVEEQKQIVATLDNLSAKCKVLRDNYTKTIALCEDMKRALLKRAFNGEL